MNLKKISNPSKTFCIPSIMEKRKLSFELEDYHFIPFNFFVHFFKARPLVLNCKIEPKWTEAGKFLTVFVEI